MRINVVVVPDAQLWQSGSKVSVPSYLLGNRGMNVRAMVESPPEPKALEREILSLRDGP